MCINFLFLFIWSSLSSLLSFSFLLFSFRFSSLRCSLSLSLKSTALSAMLSLSDQRQSNLWRWLFKDGVILVGWWLPWDSVAWVWVCRRGYRGFGWAGVGVGLPAWVVVGLGGCREWVLGIGLGEPI